MQHVKTQVPEWTRLDGLTEACEIDGGRLTLSVQGRSASCRFDHAASMASSVRPSYGTRACILPFSPAAAMTFETVADAKRVLSESRSVMSFVPPSRLLAGSGFKNVAGAEHNGVSCEIWLRRAGHVRQQISVSPDLVEFHEIGRHHAKRMVLCFDLTRPLPRSLVRLPTLVMLTIRLADDRMPDHKALAA